MKRKSACLIPLLCLFIVAGCAAAAVGDQITPCSLSSPQGSLSLDARGLSLAPRNSESPAAAATGGPLWSVVIQKIAQPASAGEQRILSSKDQHPRREVTRDAIRLVYDNLTDGEQTRKISLALEIRCRSEAFEISGELSNGEEGWLIRDINGPVLSGIKADLARQPLLLPNGLGQRINQAPGLKSAAAKSQARMAAWQASGRVSEIAAPYPSGGGAMQWCAFAGERGGLYFGCHDARHGAKTLIARYDPETWRYSLLFRHPGVFLKAGQRWTLPLLVIHPYDGNWHAAAKYYRAWFDSVTPRREGPEWARGASGWLLGILKQQNGEVMWDYPSLVRMCEVADQRGLDILGLFGWAQGGHDHLYPEYIPDPRMGGPEALRKSLAEIHRRGKRAIIYANGQLIDRSSDYWQAQGKAQAVIQDNGAAMQDRWQKYRNFPAQLFGLGCLADQGWRERLFSLARQAHELGADGILYDQLGVVGPRACYAPNHGHPAPAMVYTADRRSMLRSVADEMKKIDPNFIIMTEGIHDSVLDSVALFHGCMLGVFTPTGDEMQARIGNSSPSAAFPEMFRFTFPEVMTTIRHPTPMLDRMTANYTCVYGLRFEIESRYAPDVRYLKEGAVPASADYKEVLNPPNVAMMRATPPAEAARYQKQVVDFMRAHADFFWRGRFLDNEGFRFEGRKMMAKSFAAGDRLGVVVWNPTDEPAPFTLAVPQGKLVGASEPEWESVAPFSPLPAQTVRLLVWKKADGESSERH